MNYKKLLKPLYLFLILGVLMGCSSSDEDTFVQEEQEEVSDDTNDDDSAEDPLASLLLTDVSYGDNVQQVYDLYLPEGRTSATTKVMVLIHGGGWTSGDKSDMAQFVDFFLENHPNHAILNLNYVLASIVGPPAFPNQYLDIQNALDQVIAQQEELQILPEFGFFGTSAGAHLAMMYDYTYDTDDLVKFVIDVVGPSDFTDPFFADDPNFPIALALLVDESQFPDGTDYAVANSPALVVNSTSSPTFLFYGNQDPIVPLTNGERLNDALNTSGIPNQFTVYDGGHGDDWSVADGIDLSIQTSTYVNTYLAIE